MESGMGHWEINMCCFNHSKKILTRIIHQEIWLSARRHENGGGNIPEYVEQTICETTQQAGKFSSFDPTPKFNLHIILCY